MEAKRRGRGFLAWAFVLGAAFAAPPVRAGEVWNVPVLWCLV
ncbi:MAG TPA: hypothetical protein VF789_16485 [Thermoanaerobaculia bacterium]